MTQSKDQMRAEFEDAFCLQFKLSGTVSHCWNAIEDQYSNAHLQEHWLTWQAARASAPHGVPEGWRLVPVEATPEMLNASRWSGSGNVSVDEEWARKQVWHRMLAAAPQPVAQTVPPFNSVA